MMLTMKLPARCRQYQPTPLPHRRASPSVHLLEHSSRPRVKQLFTPSPISGSPMVAASPFHRQPLVLPGLPSSSPDSDSVARVSASGSSTSFSWRIALEAPPMGCFQPPQAPVLLQVAGLDPFLDEYLFVGAVLGAHDVAAAAAWPPGGTPRPLATAAASATFGVGPLPRAVTCNWCEKVPTSRRPPPPTFSSPPSGVAVSSDLALRPSPPALRPPLLLPLPCHRRCLRRRSGGGYLCILHRHCPKSQLWPSWSRARPCPEPTLVRIRHGCGSHTPCPLSLSLLLASGSKPGIV